jgi:transcriptional regulator with XRE-family HTH domain
MDALGIKKVSVLAERSGVDRGLVGQVVNGTAKNPRRTTIAAIEAALDRLEEEMGAGAHDHNRRATDGMVTFRLSGNFGVDVVVQGPVSNAADLEASVARLLRGMRDRDTTDQGEMEG